MFKGFSTKFDFIMPMLREDYVANEIYRAIISRRLEVFLPWWSKQLSFLIRACPTTIMDTMGKYIL